MFLFELTDAVDMLVTLVCFTIVIEDSELLCQQGHVSGINMMYSYLHEKPENIALIETPFSYIPIKAYTTCIALLLHLSATQGLDDWMRFILNTYMQYASI